jgi:cytoskeletal protein RodZ
VGSVLALVFGYLALRQIRQGERSGRGIAIAGIVLGWIGMATLIPTIIIAASAEDPDENRERAIPVQTEEPDEGPVQRPTTTERQTTTTTAPETTTTTAPPTTTTAPTPTTVPHFSAGQYEFTDVQVYEDFAGDFAVRARATNTGPTVQGVGWTSTLFSDGSVVGTLTGVSGQFAEGETITVEFVGLDDYGDWDRVEFQVDYEF